MVGIGPGSEADITPAVVKAVKEADVVVGYNYYFHFIEPYLKTGSRCVDTGMKRERERARLAFEYAEQGHNVVVISSGDAAIYGMTPLVWEMEKQREERGEGLLKSDDIASLPGISAFQKAASLLGAPIGHDFCVISLSDLMTPWAKIERRIEAAAAADFALRHARRRSRRQYKAAAPEAPASRHSAHPARNSAGVQSGRGQTPCKAASDSLRQRQGKKLLTIFFLFRKILCTYTKNVKR